MDNRVTYERLSDEELAAYRKEFESFLQHDTYPIRREIIRAALRFIAELVSLRAERDAR